MDKYLANIIAKSFHFPMVALTYLLLILLAIIYIKNKKWDISTALTSQLFIFCIIHQTLYFFNDQVEGSTPCKIQASTQPFLGIISFTCTLIYTSYVLFMKHDFYEKYKTIFTYGTSILNWCLSVFVFTLTMINDDGKSNSLGRECIDNCSYISIYLVYNYNYHNSLPCDSYKEYSTRISKF